MKTIAPTTVPSAAGSAWRVCGRCGLDYRVRETHTCHCAAASINRIGYGTGAIKAPGTGRATRLTFGAGKPAAAHPETHNASR
jgi:hypothetical protein